MNRPLTVADRLPETGDTFQTRDTKSRFFIGTSLTGGSKITAVTMGEDGKISTIKMQTGDVWLPGDGLEYTASDLIYTYREDGGAMTTQDDR